MELIGTFRAARVPRRGSRGRADHASTARSHRGRAPAGPDRARGRATERAARSRAPPRARRRGRRRHCRDRWSCRRYSIRARSDLGCGSSGRRRRSSGDGRRPTGRARPTCLADLAWGRLDLDDDRRLDLAGAQPEWRATRSFESVTRRARHGEHHLRGPVYVEQHGLAAYLEVQPSIDALRAMATTSFRSRIRSETGDRTSELDRAVAKRISLIPFARHHERARQ